MALALVAAAVLASLIWYLWSRRLVEVSTISVHTATSSQPAGSGSAFDGVLNASGYVTAQRRATVSSKITGRLVEVRVEEGSEVEAGQLLARLDDAMAQRNLALAVAEQTVARARLAETEALLTEARLHLERMESLLSHGVVSQEALDAARSAHESLAARLDAQGGEVRVAERRVAVRRQELEDTRIVAPFAGIVISKDAQEGEIVSPISAGGAFTRTGICTLVDIASLELEVEVNESFIRDVHVGQRVRVTLDSYPDWKIPGQVVVVVPTANRQKATVKVRIAFDELDPRILPDMGAQAAFLDSEKAPTESPSPVGGLWVPQSGVRSTPEDGQPFVYVVVDGHVQRRRVLLGEQRAEEVQILEGLEEGDRVVVDPPEGIETGWRVHEVPQRGL